MGDAQMAAQPFKQRIVVQIRFLIRHEQHFQAGQQQEPAEHIHQPMEFRHQSDTGKNHDRTHDDRAQYTVEQHATLIYGRHGEKAEYHQEHENIIHRQ